MTTFEDIRNKLRGIPSTASFSESRIITNENFKLFRATIESLWATIGQFYDINTGSLGSIGLHSDVSVSGPNAPSVGDGLVWNGVAFVPGAVAGGGPGGGAAFLPQLDDVQNYSYPLPDNSVLLYNLSNSRFEPSLITSDLLSDFDIQANGIPSVIVKGADDTVRNLNAGVEGTVLQIVSGTPSWQSLELVDLSDVNAPSTFDTNAFYFFNYTGSGYDLLSEYDRYGTRDFVPSTLVITVQEKYQYIVHQNLDIEGEVDVEGELVVI